MKGGNAYFKLCLFSLRTVWTNFSGELSGGLENKTKIIFWRKKLGFSSEMH